MKKITFYIFATLTAILLEVFVASTPKDSNLSILLADFTISSVNAQDHELKKKGEDPTGGGVTVECSSGTYGKCREIRAYDCGGLFPNYYTRCIITDDTSKSCYEYDEVEC
ncbi:hypothetical protein [Draconibacterium halophilum]|uniref:Uncharacterized protein n=1 Tax=Draconibacterium halophilum TaxID=2706887 RepID=A0A6C0RAS1_9BACT|nr:hypothetical protein [Draconibacterium halophilum]QIA06553.1 hypothetical protein G0Q07_01880 [Draconibacterium halophilum]